MAQSETVAKTKIQQDDIQTSKTKSAVRSTDVSHQSDSKRDNSEQDNPKQDNHQQAAASTIPQHVQQQILAKIIYPRQAKRRGLEGTAKFSLDIQQHDIKQTTLLVSTGYQILDRAARKGIVSIQSLPLPDGTHLLPITFRLH
ncbi:MAG: energy transducer TonB [Ghiorsea sp.]|nr:energy transducer TonB [Ghiorsea sp.]